MQDTWKNKIKSLCENMKIPFPLPLGKDAILSGSFMWHVLTSDDSTKWSPNDVDIFCGMTGVQRMREFLIRNGFKFSYMAELEYINDKPNFVEYWGFPTSLPYEREGREVTMLYFREFCMKNAIPSLPSNVEFGQRSCFLPSVQLIYSKTCQSDASQLVVGEFDFPILENYFDGTEVVVQHPDYVSSRKTPVRIKEYKESSHLTSFRNGRYKQRIRKYASRGVYFDPEVERAAFTREVIRSDGVYEEIWKPDR